MTAIFSVGDVTAALAFYRETFGELHITVAHESLDAATLTARGTLRVVLVARSERELGCLNSVPALSVQVDTPWRGLQ